MRGIVIVTAIFGLPGIALLSGSQSGAGEVFAGDRTTNGALGAALLAFAVFLGVTILRKATLSIAIHADGVRWREARRTRDIHWSEIVEMRGAHTKRMVMNVEVARTNVHRLSLEDGTECLFSDMLAGARVLAERIEAELLARVLPRARARLERGETVVFGPIALTPRGVERGDQVIELLETVTVEDGLLLAKGSDTHIEVQWSKIPNARVLLALLEARCQAPHHARKLSPGARAVP